MSLKSSINAFAKEIYENAVKKGFWGRATCGKLSPLDVAIQAILRLEKNGDLDAKGVNLILDQLRPEFEAEKIRHPAVKLMLIVTEVAEACEADRAGDMENFGEELADIIIRTLDLASHFDIDIGNELVVKHHKNLLREHKYGKEY